MALVVWFSKRQPTIESSAFGAEFVALKNGVETMRGLCYKLWMMGVPISGPLLVYGDNMLVIHNTQRPELLLKKKCDSICYHGVRKSIAMGETLTTHVPTLENYADLLTKVLYGQKCRRLVQGMLYDIYDYCWRYFQRKLTPSHSDMMTLRGLRKYGHKKGVRRIVYRKGEKNPSNTFV